MITADSMQVYRGMDIGTAKPRHDERADPPQHLIDIRDPCETWDAGEFRRAALDLITEIHGRSRVPLVSGGTAFYIEALLLGLPQTPPSDPKIRQEVADHLRSVGVQEAWEELRRADPEFAERIGPADPYRISRGLEILRASGQPPSRYRPVADRPLERPADIIGVLVPRPELYRRIQERAQQMLAAGLRAEVERLVFAGVGPDCPGMRAIGYREFVADPQGDDSTILSRISTATRRYAKRQHTFLQRLPGLRMLPPDQALAGLRAAVTRYASKAAT